MIYVVTHNPDYKQDAACLYGPFKSHDSAQRFVEEAQRQGLVAATRHATPPSVALSGDW